MLRSERGVEASTDNPKVIELLNTFADRMVGFRPGAGVIHEALALDPGCVLAKCYAALTCLMSDRLDGPPRARSLLRTAPGHEHRAGQHELAFCNALELWADGRPAKAAARLEELLVASPRDLLTLMIVQTLHFRSGNIPGLLRAAEAVANDNLDSSPIYGMLAFGYGEVGRFREAEMWARNGISLKLDDFGAHHSLAHVFEMEGRVQEGRDCMTQLCDTWDQASAWAQSHLWWHLSVFAADLGDRAAATQLLGRIWSDDEGWGADKDRTRYPINGIHLLWRLSMLGEETTGLWSKVGERLRNRTKDPVEPFPTILYLYALSRGGFIEEVAELLDSMEQRSVSELSRGNAVWRDVALPTALGVLEHLKGNYDESVSLLLPQSTSEWIELGHSPAQRDVLAMTLLDGLQKAGISAPSNTGLMRRAALKVAV